jgi:hypothetical protein
LESSLRIQLDFVPVPVQQQIAADVEELHKCMRATAWKSSIIMIGSLLESVLYYHIEELESVKATIPQFDLRNVGLSELLQWARQHGIIDEHLYRLSEPIREYRNTIHPRVSRRQGRPITESLVQIGYNVLLEVLHSADHRRVQALSRSADATIMDIVRQVAGREATTSDLYIYKSIFDKYGFERGATIVRRSLEASRT